MEAAGERHRISVQCVDDAEGFAGVIIYEDATFPLPSQQISIQSVDSAGGFGGAIIYNNRTFPVPSQQRAAIGAGPGSHSSVRPLQFPQPQDDEIAMERDPPDLK